MATKTTDTPVVSTSFGYADTISTTKNLAIPDLSYKPDFTAKVLNDGNVKLENLTTPLDQPETILYKYQQIKDIYDGTGIIPSYMSVSKRGLSLLAQVNDILRVQVTDASCCDNLSVIDLPMSAHVVIRVPINQHVTAENTLTVVKRAVAALFATGETGTTQLEAMLRDSLKPASM